MDFTNWTDAWLKMVLQRNYRLIRSFLQNGLG